ncbi:MAG TPA: sigma-70 family RNA polymerase sigma factor [Burkholderiaceae bacterium]|nr:sigma-70 family RNA polymerase sigma factor [Burkholderiaceae bacterium]
MDNAEVLRLLDRIGQQDEGAFRELYRAFSRRLYAYALRHLGDPAQAEEIVADSLYEVWRHPARFRGDSQFSTWLIGITRNKILMAFRSRKPDAEHEDLDVVQETVASEEAGAFELLAQAQRREGVRHCMDRLSEDHRECIHLVFYEGMSLAEVAQVQSCPENTVKTRLFHARQKLKNCLKLLVEREGGSIASVPLARAGKGNS